MDWILFLRREAINNKQFTRFWLGLMSFLLMGLLSACALAGEDDPAPTPTPPRPLIQESLYVNPQREGSPQLSLRLTEMRFPEAVADSQILAVLATGDGNPAYILYPSNQPGAREATITSLAETPLSSALNGHSPRLWVLALQHTAYSVGQEIGAALIAETLARQFDSISNTQAILAALVDAHPNLLAWFGSIEVVGELFLSFDNAEEWNGAEQSVTSADGGVLLSYRIESSETTNPDPETNNNPETNSDTANPETTPEIVAAAYEPFGTPPLEGYRRVIYENFADARSDTPWFIGRDPTYSASIIDGAYQVMLTELERRRGNTALSWGSLQEHVFDEYVIRARMRVVEEGLTARLGLWLHYQDEFNFLFFGIQNNGRFRVARFQRNYTELSPWSQSDAVHTDNGSNILEVLLAGDTYTFIVNGRTLTTVQDDVLKEGRIAFFCYAESVPATCRLEEIEIWIPESQEFPRSTDNGEGQ